MKFMILMGDGGGSWDELTAAQQAEVMKQHAELRRALEAEGKFVASFRLAPRETGKTVRRDKRGRMRVTDGPFAETREVVGGLYVIRADSREEALDWAKRSRFIAGSNEVRELVE